MRTYTFYLKNGLTFKVKAEGIKTTTSTITGGIVGYEIKGMKNFIEVNITEVVAIVEDLEE